MHPQPLCYISYLHHDTGGHADRLIALLAQEYDQEQLASRTNDDFSEPIRAKLNQACVMLVVLGPTTLEMLEARLAQNGDDPLLQEIEFAMARQGRAEALAILPVLMGGAIMPTGSVPTQLAPLKPFLGKQAIPLIDDAAAFKLLFRHLLQELEKHGMNPPRFRTNLGAARPFNVPGKLPNPHFHDPERHLKNLRQAFEDTAAANIKVLSGMGGVGKTCLAMQYCHEFQAEYAGVWWFDAGTPNQLAADCKHFIDGNHIPLHPGQTTMLAMRDWLSTQKKWLLVYDHAHDPNTVKPYLPDRGAHDVLVTSRQAAWQRMVGAKGCLPLTPWSAEQAQAFLTLRLPEENTRALSQLAHDLAGLPLTLESAARKLDATGMSAAEYIAFFADPVHQARLLSEAGPGGEPALKQSWEQAIERLQAAPRQLLNLCATCAVMPIPERLFQAHPALLPPDLAKVTQGAAWIDVLSPLQSDALLERDASNKTLLMHPLLQAVVRLYDQDATNTSVHMQALLQADGV